MVLNTEYCVLSLALFLYDSINISSKTIKVDINTGQEEDATIENKAASSGFVPLLLLHTTLSYLQDSSLSARRNISAV